MNIVKRIARLSLLAVTLLSFALFPQTRSQAQGGKEKRPVIDVTVKPADVLSQLQDLDLIPGGGTYDDIPSGAFVEAHREGFTYVHLFQRVAPREFVLQARLQADLSGTESACGLYFMSAKRGFGVAALSYNRHILLSQVLDKENVVNFDEKIDDMSGVDATDYDLDGQIHTLTVVSAGEKLSFFVNGILMTSEDAQSLRGELGVILYNEEGNSRTNGCYYDNIWLVVYR